MVVVDRIGTRTPTTTGNPQTSAKGKCDRQRHVPSNGCTQACAPPDADKVPTHTTASALQQRAQTVSELRRLSVHRGTRAMWISTHPHPCRALPRGAARRPAAPAEPPLSLSFVRLCACPCVGLPQEVACLGGSPLPAALPAHSGGDPIAVVGAGGWFPSGRGGGGAGSSHDSGDSRIGLGGVPGLDAAPCQWWIDHGTWQTHSIMSLSSDIAWEQSCAECSANGTVECVCGWASEGSTAHGWGPSTASAPAPASSPHKPLPSGLESTPGLAPGLDAATLFWGDAGPGGPWSTQAPSSPSPGRARRRGPGPPLPALAALAPSTTLKRTRGDSHSELQDCARPEPERGAGGYANLGTGFLTIDGEACRLLSPNQLQLDSR